MLIKKKRIPVLKILSVGLLPSFLKKWLYRVRGAKVGKNVHISLGSIIEGEKIEIHDGVSIGFGTIIRGRKVKIGRHTDIGSMVFIDVFNIDLGEDVLIREQVFVGGMETPESSFRVGNRSHIRQSTMINTSKPVVIGDDSAIGGRSLIFTHGTWQSKLEGYPCTFAPVTIGNNVWIAWNVFILPGVNIGDGALISAGSIVTKSIPEKSLASGNPAKIVIPSGMYPRSIDPAEQDEIMRGIIEEAWSYLRFHGIQVQDKSTKNYIFATIQVRKKRCKFLYLSNNIADIEKHFDKGLDIFVSLIEIDNEIRTMLNKKKCMWLDLAAKQRCGSTEMGEEMAAFFIRYGLRFKRVD